MQRSVTLSAPGKLNLTLEVVRRLPNGYHEIRSVFVRTDGLVDTLTLDWRGDDQNVSITASADSIPVDDTNICHRAATRYLQAIGKTASLHIHIDKRIPVAAGMGGGSSDAAAVLRGLDGLYDKALRQHELAELGAGIGKDVPFFLAGSRAAYASGMGEIIEPLACAPRLSFLIVNPGIAVATPRAYAMLDEQLPFMGARQRVDVSRMMARALQTGDAHAIAATLYNDFEPLIEREHPIVKTLKQALRAFGARGALMSGSGSTVFGVFEDEPAARHAERALRRLHPSLFIAVV
ncbi:MAG TPA: 4-(cytidine 5'-diphospho)-2-C-methyl-D-erythritol kinase [Casimicrobiaceae bacterium]|nr:4-(cytidine 5'-diphospho)-2-C-methyl-D-erythritol kinase [Casimicrobiaceae bacterium]